MYFPVITDCTKIPKWIHKPGKYIEGHDDYYISNVFSWSECATHCETYAEDPCKSFDWERFGNFCNLAMIADQHTATLSSHTKFEYGELCDGEWFLH